jgi:sugar lactone lactonase YvrE
MIVLALTASQNRAQSTYEPYTFTTLAGYPGYGSADGTGSAARFHFPQGVAVDSAGNVYVADSGNHTIRKMTAVGTNWVVTTLAGLSGFSGSADETGSMARFSHPSGVAVDIANNVYVADTFNHTIRKMTPTGVVTTLAGLAGSLGSTDGTGNVARFDQPSGVAVDNAGNVYVADTFNHTIRRVTPTGAVTTLAGLVDHSGSANGTGIVARFNGPSGVAVDNAGNVYVADRFNHTIRKMTPSGMVTTLAGLAGNPIVFRLPCGVAVDSTGFVYVADTGNYTIRRVTPTGVVTTLAGLKGNLGSTDATGSAARFGSLQGGGPAGIAVDSAGNVYVADQGNSTGRKVTPAGVVTTLAGPPGSLGSADGTGSASRFRYPWGVAVDNAGNVYVADTSNHTIRNVTPTGVVTTLAGLAGTAGSGDGTGSEARFFVPSGVTLDSAGNVYVADTFNHTIRKVTPTGMVTTLAGNASITNRLGQKTGGYADGTGNTALFRSPSGLAVDSTGCIFVADTHNHTIRKVTQAGVVTTLAGNAAITNQFGDPSGGYADGIGSTARFDQPSGVSVDSAGKLYVADTGNATIRKVTLIGTNWVVTTLAGLADVVGSADGMGSAARFYGPTALAVDKAGYIYVADASNHSIRKVTPAGVVTTLAGLPTVTSSGYPVGDSADGTGSAARFNRPLGVTVDNMGYVYVTDTLNNVIRKGYPALAIKSFGPNLGFSNGKFGFNLMGLAAQSVVVEASADLMSWLPVWTNSFAGALNFVDPQSGAYSNRFYRAFMP